MSTAKPKSFRYRKWVSFALGGVYGQLGPCTHSMTTRFMIRKALVILAPATLALIVSAETTPTVTSRVVTVSKRQFTVYDYADPTTKIYCVVIPEGLKTVRGLLVECNYAGGDSRGDWTFCHYYREFMHLHGFAFVGSKGNNSHAASFQAFRNSLQMVGVSSHHPELVNAPYATVGFSA